MYKLWVASLVICSMLAGGYAGGKALSLESPVLSEVLYGKAQMSEEIPTYDDSMPLLEYYEVANNTKEEKRVLEQDSIYLKKFLNTLTLGEFCDQNYNVTFKEWIEENHTLKTKSAKTKASKEVQWFELLDKAMQKKLSEGKLRVIDDQLLHCHTSENERYEVQGGYADIYKDEEYQQRYIVTSENSDTMLCFDEGKELVLDIGSLVEGPQIHLFLRADKVKEGVFYTKENTGFDTTNPDAVFNISFDRRSMFDSISCNHTTLPGGYYTSKMKDAGLKMEKWDPEEGIYVGLLSFTLKTGETYTVFFAEEAKYALHPDRDQEYLWHLVQGAEGHCGETSALPTLAPQFGDMSQNYMPCDKCMAGKIDCPDCVAGKVEAWKSNGYTEGGTYTSRDCIACRGTGWVKCPYCGGEGKVYMPH